MGVTGHLVQPHGPERAGDAQHGALSLARRLPALVAAAREIAASVMHGVHGRRRAGTGETFWQFRPFFAGEAATRIDWRRSARDDRLFVREREWEAAHTVWLWIDTAPSMHFHSSLARQSKGDRALVLGLAAADLLVRGGERVGLLGVTRPLASRDIVERLGSALLLQEKHGELRGDGLPPDIVLQPRARALFISDWLAEPAAVAARLSHIATRGARGHLLVVADPAEEFFPFTGHIEFRGVAGADRFRAGRAQDFQSAYLERLRTHRAEVAESARREGFTTASHGTDRPASEALLALRARFEAPQSAGGGH